MRTVNMIALILLIIGGLNWLIFGLFQWDVVGGIFGGMDSIISRIIYVIVGISAIYCLRLISVVGEEEEAKAS